MEAPARRGVRAQARGGAAAGAGAQQEAKQYAFDASQHARRAAEWEGMLRQQEAAMAAAEAVTSKRVQTATRAAGAECEAREGESRRAIEALRLQLAREREPKKDFADTLLVLVVLAHARCARSLKLTQTTRSLIPIVNPGTRPLVVDNGGK